MIKEIDEKLDLFFTSNSHRYGDLTIWKEVFDIAISYKTTNPSYYYHEVKRLRDLKNVIDYARESGIKKGMEEAKRTKDKREEMNRIAIALKASGVSMDSIRNTTGLSKGEISTL
jgi:hypothetical protein